MADPNAALLALWAASGGERAPNKKRRKGKRRRRKGREEWWWKETTKRTETTENSVYFDSSESSSSESFSSSSSSGSFDSSEREEDEDEVLVLDSVEGSSRESVQKRQRTDISSSGSAAARKTRIPPLNRPLRAFAALIDTYRHQRTAAQKSALGIRSSPTGESVSSSATRGSSGHLRGFTRVDYSAPVVTSSSTGTLRIVRDLSSLSRSGSFGGFDRLAPESAGIGVPLPEVQFGPNAVGLNLQLSRECLQQARRSLARLETNEAALALEVVGAKYFRRVAVVNDLCTLVPRVMMLNVDVAAALDRRLGPPGATPSVGQSGGGQSGGGGVGRNSGKSRVSVAREALHTALTQIGDSTAWELSRGRAAKRQHVSTAMLLERAEAIFAHGPAVGEESNWMQELTSVYSIVSEQLGKPPFSGAAILHGLCGEVAFFVSMQAGELSADSLAELRASRTKIAHEGVAHWLSSAREHLERALALWGRTRRRGSGSNERTRARAKTPGPLSSASEETESEFESETESESVSGSADATGTHAVSPRAGDPVLWHAMLCVLAILRGESVAVCVRDFGKVVGANPEDPTALVQYLLLLKDAFPTTPSHSAEKVASAVRILQLDPISDLGFEELSAHFLSERAASQPLASALDDALHRRACKLISLGRVDRAQPEWETIDGVRADKLSILCQPLIDAFVERTLVLASWGAESPDNPLLPSTECWHTLALAVVHQQTERLALGRETESVDPQLNTPESAYSGALKPFRAAYGNLLGDLVSAYRRTNAMEWFDSSGSELGSAGEERRFVPPPARPAVAAAPLCGCGLFHDSSSVFGSASPPVAEISGFPLLSAEALRPSLSMDATQPALLRRDGAQVSSSEIEIPVWWHDAVFPEAAAEAMSADTAGALRHLEQACAMFACCYFFSGVDGPFCRTLFQNWTRTGVEPEASGRLRCLYALDNIHFS
jgi:hypothetical protein